MILTNDEVKTLTESPEALAILCDYHDLQWSMADAMDFPESVEYHKYRYRSLKEEMRRLTELREKEIDA